MLTLIQFPWSPYCITTRHILERHDIRFRIRNIPFHERDGIITATHGRGHTVPCLLDGRQAVVDHTDGGQEVARYLDRRYTLGLFPKAIDGLQAILVRYIEQDLESVGFKITYGYLIPTRPLVERVMLIRHKERKFGRGCVSEWRAQHKALRAQFAELLEPLDNMVATSPYLLGDRPLFADYSLYGVIENYLFSGKTRLPPFTHLRRWYRAMSSAT